MIDIVIASKNQAGFLPATLKGLKSQSFKEFNIICIDGFSEDGTDSLIKELPNSLLEYSSASVEMAYIEGVRLSSSKYISFATTSDYLIDDTWFDTAQKILDSDDNVDIVWASGINISESGDFLSNNLVEAMRSFPLGYRGTLDKYLLVDFYIPELSYVIRRDILIEIIERNRLETLIPEGKNRYEFWYYIILYLLENKSIVSFLPKRVFAGRIHSNSVTSILSQKHSIRKIIIHKANSMFDFISIIYHKYLQKNIFILNYKYSIKEIMLFYSFLAKYFKVLVRSFL